jgi:glycosyltransferase involved in cell wall biosynthesis
MTERPRVTILLNNYNYGDFLAASIDSALNQTYPNTEVVVVDDGSTDESRTVIACYAGHVIPVLKSNGGQASAYNAGFAASSGEVVCLLDSDDTLYPTAVEQAVHALAEPRVVKAQWPLAVIDAEGSPTGELSTKRTPPDGDLREMVRQDGPFYDFDLTTGAAYAREMLAQVLPAPEPPYRNGADVYLITLAPIYGLIRNVTEPQGTYRAHGRNNYRGRKLNEDRVSNYIARFEANCLVLAEHFRRQGQAVEPSIWREQNFNYLWPTRLLRAWRDIGQLVPNGGSYVLVDGDELGECEPLTGRRAIPFIERDGHYWGPPADDETAVRELERLRSAGATHLVFWWTCFWWLEHYTGMARWLRSQGRVAAQGDHLLAFDLRPRA